MSDGDKLSPERRAERYRQLREAHEELLNLHRAPDTMRTSDRCLELANRMKRLQRELGIAQPEVADEDLGTDP